MPSGAAAHATHAQHVATSTATAPPQQHAQQQQAHQHPQGLQAATNAAAAAAAAVNSQVGAHNPYQAYGLPNVDMSSFQNVDWSSMYGMGMYV